MIDVLGELANSFIVNEDFDNTGKKVDLLKNGLGKEDRGNQLRLIILLARATESRGVLPRGSTTSKNTNA